MSMNYKEACKKAYHYFKDQLNITGLSTATEDDERWFFSAGKNSAELIGNTIISISKSTGTLDLVDILSDDGFEMLKVSKNIDIPKEFCI